MFSKFKLFSSLICISLIVFSCVSTTEKLQIENHVSGKELSRFSDTFSSLDEDLWEPAANASEWQEENFKLGTIRIEDDKLLIKTKTDAFSKAVLSSKFHFRGDFDFQIDCSIDLNKNVQNMTQNLYVAATEQSKKKQTDSLWIELIRDPKETPYSGRLNCGVIRNGKSHMTFGPRLTKFQGSIRIVRKENKVSMLYKKNKSEDWKNLGNYNYNKKDQYIRLAFSNYFMQRKQIKADRPLECMFDNFRVNAAHQIIESDI